MPPQLWAGAVLIESATALCATVNLAYFVSRVLSPLEESRERRLAAFVLAIVSLGVLLGSLVVLSMQPAAGEAMGASAVRAVARAVTFAGAFCMSALILRRVMGADSL